MFTFYRGAIHAHHHHTSDTFLSDLPETSWMFGDSFAVCDIELLGAYLTLYRDGMLTWIQKKSCIDYMNKKKNI